MCNLKFAKIYSKLLFAIALLVFLIFNFELAAQQSYLVKDINTTVKPLPGMSATKPVVLNGTAYFVGDDSKHQGALWKTDGTTAGTQMLYDSYYESSAAFLTVVGGNIFFALNGSYGAELWKTDGTVSGTVQVKDINSIASYGSLENLINVNGTLFFTAIDSGFNRELWKSDGTTAGTFLVSDINGSNFSSNLSSLTNVNGTLFFSADDGANGSELWKSDGTAVGTVLVKDISSSGGSSPGGLINNGGILYFGASNGIDGTELWKSDGTSVGTVLVKNINTSGSSSPQRFVVNGTSVFFRADDGINGNELWKSDGTNLGTVMVSNINPVGSSFISELTTIGTVTYFRADNGSVGSELWRSDGTNAGTVLVKDINASGSSFPIYLENINGTLYLSADDGVQGAELWKSDGTTSGTTLVKDINIGGNSGPSLFTQLGSAVLFRAAEGADYNHELWTTDGTNSGTSLVKEIHPGRTSSLSTSNFSMAHLNGYDYFPADNGTDGSELWRTDGTGLGTTMVKDISSSNPAYKSSFPKELIAVNGVIYFSAQDGPGNHELWKTDGTAAGTVLVKDIHPSGASSPRRFSNLNGDILFVAYSPSTGTELWKSDGTTSGTNIVKDIRPGAWAGMDNLISQFPVLNGFAYFGANDGVNGKELWKSDGTNAGTTMVKDINPVGNGGGGGGVLVNNLIFFPAFDGVTSGIWRTDGTSSGTFEVKSVQAGFQLGAFIDYNGNFMFSLNNNNNSSSGELWKSDGTIAGTALVKIINPTGYNGIAYSTVFNNELYFSANDGINGAELWKSDGTTAGTVMVKEINQQNNLGSFVSDIEVHNGLLYFYADDGISGKELWKSDGTAIGTVLASDIMNGPETSYPGFPGMLQSSNGNLYTLASGEINPTFNSDLELWNLGSCQSGNPNIVQQGLHYAHHSSVDSVDTNYNCYCDAYNNFVMSLDTNGTNVEFEQFALTMNLSSTLATYYPFQTGFILDSNGSAVINRSWDLRADQQPTSNVGVRYYFTQAEYNALNNELSNNSLTPMSSPSQLWLYKSIKENSPHAPISSITVDSVIILENNNYISDTTWKLSAHNTNNYRAEFTVSSFSGGGGGGTPLATNPLPILLESFTAVKLETSDLLEWTTTQEYNNSHFIIQRSIDGLGFDNIGQVNSKAIDGKSVTPLHYSFEDYKPLNGSNYYRLEEIDRDGKSSFSSLVNVFWDKEISVSTFPNPSNGILYISISSPKVLKVQVNLRSIDGQIIKTISKNSNHASSKIEFDLRDISTGSYIVEVLGNGKQIVSNRIFKL